MLPDRPTFDEWRDRAATLALTLDGKELKGPCPSCGGEDRFSVKRGKDGRALIYCRQCQPCKSNPDAFKAIMAKAGFAATAWEDLPQPEKQKRRAERKAKETENAAIERKLDLDGLDHARFALQWRSWYGDNPVEQEHVRFRTTSPSSAVVYAPGEGWIEGERAVACVHRSMRTTIEALCHALPDDKINAARARWLQHAQIAGALRLAAADEVLLREPEDWNTEPDMAGLPDGGIANLSASMRCPPDPYAFITKRLGAVPDPDCRADMFRELIDTITQGDETFETALQALAGALIVGKPDRLLPTALGPTGTGKTQIAEVLLAAGGDYMAPLRPEILSSRPNEHPVVNLTFRGKRGVVAVEMRGGSWQGGLIKRLTGGDSLSGREIRGEREIAFRATHTILLACNERDLPVSTSLDPALAARVRILPFVNKPERDIPNLAHRIIDAELPYVVTWMIEGASLALERGLRQVFDDCDPIREATAAWKASADRVQTWLDDCTLADPTGFASRKELRQSYSDWCDGMGEPKATASQLFNALTEKSFTERKRKGVRGFIGLKLSALL